jgi:hypothetical protein
MHSVTPQQTIADQNLYVMLIFVLIVHSIITYLLLKFETFIETLFGIQETCVQKPSPHQQSASRIQGYRALVTDSFFL